MRRNRTDKSCFCQWRDGAAIRGFTSAVSLHSHTEHSRESLEFIPRLAHAVPVLSGLVKRQEVRFARMYGEQLDFSKGYWTPPLSASEALALETRAISSAFGLYPLVSLTDHDTIEGCSRLRVLPTPPEVPISFEWTVPWRRTLLHVGVHNLPARSARVITEELLRWTRTAREGQLRELLEFLHSHPETLLVLNHPLWDEAGVGAAAHRELLGNFVNRHLGWIHALEVNGLRSWTENRAVMEMANALGVPAVSGGDRHALEPAAILNLTRAASFGDFAREVREGCSRVLFTNTYHQSLRLRLLHNVVDVMRDHPELPAERQRWTGRVWFALPGREPAPLSSWWADEGPVIVQLFAAATRLLAHERVREALRLPGEALRRRRTEMA